MLKRGGLFCCPKVALFTLGNKIKSKKDYTNFTPQGEPLAYELRKIIRNHFPDLSALLQQLPDSRERRDYQTRELLMAAIGMYIFKEGSRNALNNDRLHSQEFSGNFEKLFQCRLPHMDTTQTFLETLPAGKIEEVKTDLISRLIDKKVFYPYKMFGCYLVAIDASGVVSSTKDIFGCGLKKESKNGVVTYQYHVLEAKLVSENGLCIPLMSEWIVNDEQHADTVFNKQDCEQKAFKRLAAKLKKAFPRLPICILADALYASDPVMTICQNNEWKYIITLQDGSLPSLQNQLKDDPQTQHNTARYQPVCTNKNLQINQSFYWVEDLLHKQHCSNYIECTETITHLTTTKTSQQKFVRITNLPTSKTTIQKLSNAGRLRWKIENEGFNTQKNNGYAMEHLYARKSFNAFKHYYQCMQIAHLINQFAEHGLTIQDTLKQHNKLTIRHIWKKLIASMQCIALCPQALDLINTQKQQIRLAPA